VKANGIALFYKAFDWEDQSKIPVVCLHGGQVDGNSWNTIVHVFSSANPGYRYLVFDSRGHGKTGEHNNVTSMTFDDMVTDFKEALTDLLPAPTKFHLWGYSMGGRNSYLLASSIPDRVIKLTLFSPVPASGVTYPEGVSGLDMIRMMRGFYEQGGDAFRQGFAGWGGGKLSSAWPTYEQSFFDAAKNYYKQSDEVISTMTVTSGGKDVRSELKKITCPVLILTGDRDVFLKPLLDDYSLKFTGGWGSDDISLSVMHDGSHLFGVDYPVETVATVAKFMRK